MLHSDLNTTLYLLCETLTSTNCSTTTLCSNAIQCTRPTCHVHNNSQSQEVFILTLKVLVTTIDAQWEGMGDVGSARYEPALLPPCPTIRVLTYSN